MNAFTLEVEVDGVVRQLVLERGTAGYTVQLDGRAVAVDVREMMPGVLSLLMDGRAYRCVRTTAAEEQTITVGGQPHRVSVVNPRSLRGQRKGSAAGNGASQIKASMPGRVVRVLVAEGDAVVAQQGIVVIEAMKMQNELKAPRDGKIAELRAAPGDTVASGQVLAVLESSV